MPGRAHPALLKKIANLWRLGDIFEGSAGFSDDGGGGDNPPDVDVYVLATEGLAPILTEDGQYIQP